ncbi:MAG: CYTH domain-containing protein [Burkholderiaceae bacterium]
MGVEIERKFLVVGEAWRQGRPDKLRQGYLNRDKQRTVRVRIAGAAGAEQAWLTIKGESAGATRAEFEYPLPLADARQLLALCDGPLIEKRRYRLLQGQSVWEVDEFLGDNAGLVVAEIELDSADQAFERPDWLGEEVTEDPRYFNSSLASHPFKQW